MARRLGPRLKHSRRYGTALFGTAKEAKVLQRRNYPPGQHGPAASGRISEYGTQLREKQKAKLMYGLLERQFRRYFQEALRRTGDTGEVLLQYLERRLDNVVYRLGWGTTRAQARQLVSHGHILVNDRRIDIPSYRVQIGDRIQIRPQSQPRGYFTAVQKSLENYQAPAWLESQPDKLSGKILEFPTGDQLERGLQPQLIVEFYSR